MNIAKILKDCPKGTKLYSPVYGEVQFLYVDNGSYPITVDTDNDTTASFTLDGRLDANYDGECMIFPSKDNRDWSTFKVHKKEYKFKPFDKVLVRDADNDTWRIDLFGWITNISNYKYKTMTSGYKQCIPYEGNEHLLSTTNNPE